MLSLVLVATLGSQGVDVAFGSSQRFGVPMGYGCPYAAAFATHDEIARHAERINAASISYCA
ncbi:MAG: Glycine dehydrogenase (decarboxylating) [Sodalis sp.]|uniref:hypothetical protein n=1 Tax=Sodalis sp. (in: enterobacteria) TaxID=1898979 RepID=UPI003873A4F8|nr:MAG: Glycine dehydrogenase (decarboxylating) [Sodalis sp.]